MSSQTHRSRSTGDISKPSATRTSATSTGQVVGKFRLPAVIAIILNVSDIVQKRSVFVVLAAASGHAIIG